jgi:hypothetical protein
MPNQRLRRWRLALLGDNGAGGDWIVTGGGWSLLEQHARFERQPAFLCRGLGNFPLTPGQSKKLTGFEMVIS